MGHLTATTGDTKPGTRRIRRQPATFIGPTVAARGVKKRDQRVTFGGRDLVDITASKGGRDDGHGIGARGGSVQPPAGAKQDKDQTDPTPSAQR